MTVAAEVYELLRFDAPDETRLTRRDTDIEIDGALVAHAIDSLNRRAFVVPLTGDEPAVSDNESRALSLETFTTEDTSRVRRLLIIRCLEKGLNRQFALLVDDMASALRLNDKPPGEICLEVLHRWRKLFAEGEEYTLSFQEQIGLISELHLFEGLARHNRISVFESWRGPDRSRHDFVSAACAIEVKATTQRDQLLVNIHGGLQLEVPPQGPLFLFVEQLELSPYGDSVPSLVNRILGLGIDAQRFLQILGELGYRHEDEAKYSGFKFSTLRQKLCEVNADFPRLVRSSLARPEMMDQFVRIDYVIDVGPLPSVAADGYVLQESVRRLG